MMQERGIPPAHGNSEHVSQSSEESGVESKPGEGFPTEVQRLIMGIESGTLLEAWETLPLAQRLRVRLYVRQLQVAFATLDFDHPLPEYRPRWLEGVLHPLPSETGPTVQAGLSQQGVADPLLEEERAVEARLRATLARIARSRAQQQG